MITIIIKHKKDCLLRPSTISHINYLDQVNSWKNLWKFWNGPVCRNKSGPSPLLNVAGYWKSSNTEACVQKLSQILASNIDHEGDENWSQNLCEVLQVEIYMDNSYQ